MFRHLHGVGVILLALAGCSEEPGEIPISVALAPGAAVCGATQATRSVSALKVASLRFSVYTTPGAGAAGTLVCDQVAGADWGSVPLRLPVTGTTRLSLLVEAFDLSTPPRLLAAGGAVDFNLTPRLRPLKVLLSEAGSSSCTPGSMSLSRSFHSATALPNGQVLIIGGLTAEAPGSMPATDRLWATGSVEVYDPRTGLFSQTKTGLQAGRAMHEALLLTTSGPGPYDLLLIGGVTAKAGSATPVTGPGGPLPVSPEQGVATAPSLLVRYYPWASPPQVQEMSGSPQLKDRVLPTLVTDSSGQTAVLGGVLGLNGTNLVTVDDFELFPTSGSSAHTGAYPLARGRVGAVAAPLSATELLLFGGNLGSAQASLQTEAAETITLDTSPRAALSTVEKAAQSLVSSVAHATLSPYGNGQLLLAGGLTVAPGKALSVRADKALLRLSKVGTELRVSTLSASGFAPVAYHRATPLPGGDVLLSGGMPTSCPGSVGTPCATTAAYTFLTATESLRTESPLKAPRMGHRATRLAHGAILLTGGLDHDGTRLRTHRSAELFGPLKVDPFGRGAGQVKKECR